MSSNFWQALATGGTPVAGGVPFISPSLDVSVDALNFFWDSLTDELFLGTNGDYSGTGRLNLYGRADTYQPHSQQLNPLGSLTVSGYIVRSSRGTAQAPTVAVSGDFLGKFSAVGYTGSIPAYQEFAAINTYSLGSVANNQGGMLGFAVKADGGAIIEPWQLRPSGALMPTLDGAYDIGGANLGIRNLYVNSTLSAVVGAQVINNMAGRFIAAAAATGVVITNSRVNANSIVIAQPAQNDTTGRVTAVVAAAGSFTVHLTAPTANMAINFVVLSKDI